jgi:hypothetical protein
LITGQAAVMQTECAERPFSQSAKHCTGIGGAGEQGHMRFFPGCIPLARGALGAYGGFTHFNWRLIWQLIDR